MAEKELHTSCGYTDRNIPEEFNPSAFHSGLADFELLAIF